MKPTEKLKKGHNPIQGTTYEIVNEEESRIRPTIAEQTTWIPKPNEIVMWQNKLFKVISCNMGGKCKIKQLTTTGRITKKFSNIDVTELKKS